MKISFYILFCFVFPFCVSAQANNHTPSKTFTVNELFKVLDTLSRKDLNKYLIDNGCIFEKQGFVYSPKVNGPVKNAYTLRYTKDSFHLIISFYNDTKYQIVYFLLTAQALNTLIDQAKQKGFEFKESPTTPGASTGFYKNYYISTFDNSSEKVFDIVDTTLAKSLGLSSF